MGELAVVAVTRRGVCLGERLSRGLEGQLYVPARFCEAGRARPYEGSLREVVAEVFGEYRGLVLIMATGISVRLIAPHLKDKRTDPAVVVVDDGGRYAVSLLSGHLGGANALAQRVAALIGAQAIITTASDGAGILSPDLLAKDRGWDIENWATVTRVSAALVNGETVGLYQDAGEPIDEGLPESITTYPSLEALEKARPSAALIVTDKLVELSDALSERAVIFRPKSLVLGLGCNRGTSAEEIRTFVEAAFQDRGLSLKSVRNIATIDIKRDEAGIAEYAQRLGVAVDYFPNERLAAVPDLPTPSEVTWRAVGVSGVCEPAALLSAGARELVVTKQKRGNVTLAVARVVCRAES